ncbi:hypothetical protein evm_001691 [Chilo suppressalis]|nr:hypothetical protein evm_001691 [Chilo suppressalis]
MLLYRSPDAHFEDRSPPNACRECGRGRGTRFPTGHDLVQIVLMLLVADDLYSVTGFEDGEIPRGPQAKNWRVPLKIFQADLPAGEVSSPSGASEPLELEGVGSTWGTGKNDQKVFREPVYIERKHRRYSWFELMQIYDKVSDSIFMFNKIYSGQVFIMFSSWLLCTLLTLCRFLSPTVKLLEVIFSDLFMYLCLNGRPIYLTKICEMFIEERKKTLAILMNHLIRGNLDNDYSEQVEKMIDLVQMRKLKITGNVFTVDAVTVMNFSGRVVSYAVLMIQYFYLYIFTK